MTMNDYIANPMGKKNAVWTSFVREASRNEFVKKFDTIMVREHGKIDYKLYKDDDKHLYYAWIKVPSETIEKFYYDVVIEFSGDSGKDLFDYNIRVYSNDPAFVYTYAYAFKKNKMFITEFKTKMTTRALDEKANEKNPTNSTGYTKSIYFGYLVMLRNRLQNFDRFNIEAAPLQIRDLVASVEHADFKIAKRQEAVEKIAKEKRREKIRKAKEQQQKAKDDKRISKASNTIKVVRKTNNRTKTVSFSKNTKIVKRK